MQFKKFAVGLQDLPWKGTEAMNIVWPPGNMSATCTATEEEEVIITQLTLALLPH
jgi:hypothetical protein